MSRTRSGTRPYRSAERAERRSRTQLAILAAAEAVFKERGYASATMQAVADGAGVSLPTVYLYFRSKPALVRSLADAISSTEEFDVKRALGQSDPLRMFETGARVLRLMHQRGEVVADVLRSAAGGDPELSLEWRRWQRRHLEAMKAVADSLEQQEALQGGLDAASAADVLYTIGGPETFRQLVRERGWSATRYERWIAEAARRLLLA